MPPPLSPPLLDIDWNPDELSEANLRESILQRIRIGIVSGQIPPNALLTVPSLSRQLGVSTTPIREALLELSNTGLIEARRNRGFRVCETSPKDLKDLFAIRAQLEAYAVSLVPACPPDEKSALDALAKAVDEAVRRGDTLGYISTDRAFHRRLVALADNPKLTQMIMELRNNMRLYGIETAAGVERQRRSVQEHYQLVELLADGNNTDACALITTHILDWQPIFLSALAVIEAPAQ